MKTILDGLTCIMMLMIIMLSSKILFPDKTEALLNDIDQRWDTANEYVEESESSPQSED